VGSTFIYKRLITCNSLTRFTYGLGFDYDQVPMTQSLLGSTGLNWSRALGLIVF